MYFFVDINNKNVNIFSIRALHNTKILYFYAVLQSPTKMPMKDYLYSNAANISSIAGLLFSLANLILTYNYGAENPQLLSISFAILLVILMGLFVYTNFKYAQKIQNYDSLLLTNNNILRENNKKDVELKSTPETLSDINYYNETTWIKLENIIVKGNKQGLTEKDMCCVCDILFSYLVAFTSCIQSYYSSVTGDKCAVTIKLIRKTHNQDMVKTFFRDPISFPKRAQNDKRLDGSKFIYRTEENTGFSIILDKKYYDLNFSCDDLASMGGNYSNTNPNYRKFYNATIIEPITIKKQDKFAIKEFVCVDNLDGNLNRKGLKYTLECCAIQLYSLFERFEQLNNQNNNITYDHELKRAYYDWD